ncbi:MAG: alpha/beta hydrolase [Anaerolineae bacterium]|nr:alpha/beta hydrolase [Anaerolineae bacterium]
MIFYLFVIVVLLFLSFAVLWALSPAKIKPVLNENGKPPPNSLSEKIHVPINGFPMGFFIQSKDINNPVLLFLHGGPGLPEYFITEQYPTGLENDFTMVWWDQRGAGLSYSPNIPPASMTVEQFIEDTVAVSNYLRQRFHKDKIYLMAHSGGSFFGIQAAARYPDLFYAYIGMGQMTYQLKSEMLAYVYMLEQYRANGNQSMLKKLQKAAPTLEGPLPRAYDLIRDDAMHALGFGTTRDMLSIVSGVFFPSWLSPQLTLTEKINLWRGKIFSRNTLRDTMFATDLTQQVRRLNLPVYFLVGKYDYTCSYQLAKEYLNSIDAPVKGFYTFENSAHSPFFEEPQRVRLILQEDVIHASNLLADKY